jgi:hypothetical protein
MVKWQLEPCAVSSNRQRQARTNLSRRYIKLGVERLRFYFSWLEMTVTVVSMSEAKRNL